MGRSGRKQSNIPLMIIVAIASWLIPGGGYFILKEYTRAVIICVTILLTFAAGLYIGTIGVINSVDAKPWFVAQLMNSPFVAILGRITSSGQWPVHGRPAEIGQIYTSISGILNLLCIVKAIQSASVPYTARAGGQSL